MEEEVEMSEEDKREILHGFRNLVKSQAWGHLEKLGIEQCALRLNRVGVNPLKSFDDALMENYEKGERSGIALFLHIPATIIEQFEEELKELEDESSST